MNRGKWRDLFEPQSLEVMDATMPRSEEWITYGKEVYERRCIGCHGAKGDGNGLAATFMYKQRPRDFSAAVFKFRLTKEPLPTDGDLLRTITRGVRGTAMPAWYELPINDRLAVIQYIKYELAVDRSNPSSPHAYFIEEPPGPPLYIGKPPIPSKAILDRGKEVWQIAKCWECHGQGGKGDGQKAAGLKDDGGFAIPPADLTSGQFKSGPAVEDIFRTMTTGLSGTPMPSYRDLFRRRIAGRCPITSALSAFKIPCRCSRWRSASRLALAERSRARRRQARARLCARQIGAGVRPARRAGRGAEACRRLTHVWF